MEVAFSSAFARAFKKVVKGRKSLEDTFWAKVDIFLGDPYDKRLRTHKLTGKLRELWSFSVTYDVRVVFFFAESDKAVFVDIGDHDSVY